MKMIKSGITKDQMDNLFTVHLKGGDTFEAISSFDVEGVVNDLVITKIVFKAYDMTRDTFVITTVDENNIEYIEERYTDDIWEQFLSFEEYDEVVELSEVEKIMYG